MENLSLVAVNNLIFLSKRDKFLANQYKLINKEFISSENDDNTYDTIYSFNELEYPIYFTFHQVMNHIHSSYESTIHGYTRQQIIRYMNEAMISLLEYYENIEERDESFEYLIDDLEEKVYIIEGYYKYGWFLWIPTKIKEYLNYACLRALKVSRDITDEYIQYLQGPCGYDNLDDSNDQDSDEESAGNSDGDGDGGSEGDDGDGVDGDDGGSEDDKKEN